MTSGVYRCPYDGFRMVEQERENHNDLAHFILYACPQCGHEGVEQYTPDYADLTERRANVCCECVGCRHEFKKQGTEWRQE